MGKYVDNKTTASNRKKAAKSDSIKGSVGLKGSYTEEEKLKSQAQARSDGGIQAKAIREREERLAKLEETDTTE